VLKKIQYFQLFGDKEYIFYQLCLIVFTKISFIIIIFLISSFRTSIAKNFRKVKSTGFLSLFKRNAYICSQKPPYLLNV